MPAAAPPTTELGRFLDQLRRDHNLKQEDLAAKIGVSQSTVSRAMNGEISAGTAIKIEREFGLLAGTVTGYVTGPYWWSPADCLLQAA